MAHTKAAQYSRPVYGFLIFLFLLWMALRALQWEIVEIVTPFLMLPYWLLCLALACAIVVICLLNIVRAIRAVQSAGWTRSARIDMAIAALLIGFLFLPFRVDSLYEKARFALLSPKFEAAISEAALAGAQAGHVSLPPSYAGLSRGGGDAIVCGEGSAKAVLFYSFRGVLDNFSVYAYAPNPEAYAALTAYTPWFQVIPIRENWYFCASK